MYNIIDLFSGAGGFSLGFKKAGFNVQLAIDFNKHAIKTHHYNFPESLSLELDLTKITTKEILDNYNVNKNKIDGIIGGPPCQGFSIAGRRMIDDPRNRLFLEFLKFVEYIRPPFFVIENVQGLLSMNNGSVKNEIIELFSNLGYTVKATVLTASDFNVPQIRKRVFFLGLLDKEPFFPEPITTNPISTYNAIKDLPYLELGEGEEELILEDGTIIYNHYAFPVNDLNKRRFESIPQGGSYKDIPDDLKRNKEYKSAYRRLPVDRPAYTIHAHFRDEYMLHPIQNRTITVREAARLQSFPDEFKFIGPRSRNGQIGQVGNAVPPLLAEALANKIKDFL